MANGTFVRLVMSQPGFGKPGERVTGRCVELNGAPHLSLTIKRQSAADITENIPLLEVVRTVCSKLGSGWHSALLCTTERDWQITVPREINDQVPRLISHKPSTKTAPCRRHDQAKQTFLDASAKDWLHGLGVTDAAGKVRASMADKHRQIHHYLELFSHLASDCGWQGGLTDGVNDPSTPAPFTRPSDTLSPHPMRGEGNSAPLTIADMGCGKGYLTFGVWHLFHRVWQRPVRVIGVEARPDLVQFNCRVARQIGAQELEFVEGTICSVPLTQLDALIALHACDTATDSAIIRGVRLGAKLIVVAPCCHRELRPKLRHAGALAPVLRHGLMEERLAEWLTDALRALCLEWAGYRTKMMEFVSAGHTPKNLMIAAVKTHPLGGNAAARERIERLKAEFGLGRVTLDDLLEMKAE